MTKSAKNTKNSQKQRKNTKNDQKWPKIEKTRKCQIWGVPRGAPRAPKKKASLSNRRIGTRNTDSHMVSIQKGQKSTPIFRGCARPPKKGRIKAKLKFFFELFQKTSKIRLFDINLANFDHFSPFFAKNTQNGPNRQKHHFQAIFNPKTALFTLCTKTPVITFLF